MQFSVCRAGLRSIFTTNTIEIGILSVPVWQRVSSEIHSYLLRHEKFAAKPNPSLLPGVRFFLLPFFCHLLVSARNENAQRMHTHTIRKQMQKKENKNCEHKLFENKFAKWQKRQTGWLAGHRHRRTHRKCKNVWAFNANICMCSVGRNCESLANAQIHLATLCASGYCRLKVPLDGRTTHTHTLTPLRVSHRVAACPRRMLHIWPTESYPESVFKANFICNTICAHTPATSDYTSLHLHISRNCIRIR